MISADSFFSDTLNTVDSVIGNFVNTAYSHFVQANTTMVTLLFTVYVMILGYRFATHQQQADLVNIIRHLVVLLCVYALVMSWQLYNIFIYNIFTNEPGNIAQVLINAAAGNNQSSQSISQALDSIYAAVIKNTINFFGQVGFSTTGIAFLFYGLLVFVIGTIMCVIALLLFIYAKMAMAISLALGPIFILFILWDSTRSIFAAWLRKLITLALIPIVTSAILVLMLSVINVTLPQFNQPLENQQFYGIAPFLGLSLATALLLTQVFSICSALGGGITLASLSKGADIAQNAIQKSGVATMSRKAANFGGKRSSSVNRGYRSQQ